jgi:tRNA pseudouridine(38-40) synthase
MQGMAGGGKASGLQIFMRLGYGGERFWGVTPQPDGACVFDAVLGRLRRALPHAQPYAVCWAARTDRGVHARQNWLSFRLRHPGDARPVLEALEEAQETDGLHEVRAQQVAVRLMARNCAWAKHYRYHLPGGDGAALARLQAAARVLSGTLWAGRLAHPGALRGRQNLWRPGIVVRACAHPRGGHSVDVWGGGFWRRQVRYMVAALDAVRQKRWSVHDLAALAQGQAGPLRPGFAGPATPEGLTLMALLPDPAWQPYVQLAAPADDAAAFAPWLAQKP